MIILNPKVMARIRIGILVLAGATFVFSIYNIASYYLDEILSKKGYGEVRDVFYSNATATGNSSIPEKQVTDESRSESAKDNELIVLEQFKGLLEINEDVVGWIKIDATNVDYPVVQESDNDFYLNRDINKQENVNGSIFMDYRNDIEGGSRHLVLYGHNMKNKSMFADLLNYESRWYLKQHPIIHFDTLYGKGKWEIFSVHFTDIHYDYIKTEFSSNEEFKLFAEDLQARSLHKTDIVLSEKDIILTLSTCSTSADEDRFAVHARLMIEEQKVEKTVDQ